MEKLAFYKQNIENSLANIINTRAQDNNFDRQWIQLHLAGRDLQYAISQLSTLNLRVMQQIASYELVSANQLVADLDLNIGVVTKHLNKLSRLGFVARKHPDEKQEVYQLTRPGQRVVETQKPIAVLLDQQHERMVDKYTIEELETVAHFLKDLQQGH